MTTTQSYIIAFVLADVAVGFNTYMLLSTGLASSGGWLAFWVLMALGDLVMIAVTELKNR